MKCRCVLCDEHYQLAQSTCMSRDESPRTVTADLEALSTPRGPDGERKAMKRAGLQALVRPASPATHGICPTCRLGGASTPVRRQASEEGAYEIGLVHAEWVTRDESRAHEGHCAACRFAIEDTAVKALGRLWHRECFACNACHVPLLPSHSPRAQGGDWEDEGTAMQFFLVGELPLCEVHFLEHMATLSDGAEDEDKDEEEEEGEEGLEDDGHAPLQDEVALQPDEALVEGSTGGGEGSKEGQQEGRQGQGWGSLFRRPRLSTAASLPVTDAPDASPTPSRSDGDRLICPSPERCHSLPGAGVGGASPPHSGARGRGRSRQQALERRDSVGMASWESRDELGQRVQHHRKHPTSLFDVRSVLADLPGAEDEEEPVEQQQAQEGPCKEEGSVGSTTQKEEEGVETPGTTAMAPSVAPTSGSPPREASGSCITPLPLPPSEDPTPPPSAEKAASRKSLRDPLPPLSNGTALSYGIAVASQMLAPAPESSPTRQREREKEDDKARFGATRQLTLSYNSSTFFFEESAPLAFADLRALFGLPRRAYQLSMADLIGGKSGEGKSGSLFFHSADGVHVVKTLSEAEHAFLLRCLPSYSTHMTTHSESTLLPRFLGLYCVKLPSKPACRLVVMKNVFAAPPSLHIVQRYDLKGSLLKRRVTTEDVTSRHVGVLKDLNFCATHDGTDDHGHEVKGVAGPCRCLHLGGPRRVELLSSLQQDVAWLELHNVMDYSLLVGVACPSSPSPSSPTIQDLLAKLPGGGDEAERHRRYSLWSPMSKAEGAEPGPTAVGHATEKPEAPPAERQQEGEEGEGGHVFLLGLVDVLQEYNLKKKMETLYKTGLYSFEGKDPRGLSVVDPATYAKRLLAFVEHHTD